MTSTHILLFGCLHVAFLRRQEFTSFTMACVVTSESITSLKLSSTGVT